MAAGILAGAVAPMLEDFQLLKVLGKGSYGKVMLVKHKDREEVFAMKMLNKDNLVKRNQVEHTMTERSVLESVSHPFIVNLHFAFQTPKKLYMVLEFCSGGELFFHLSRAGRFSESRTKFYAAEILLGIEYLHSLRIIYRDLKPENLLLDREGHVKITDFGLSKEGIQDNVSAKTVCGTPEYLAPEILDKRGHGRAVDWYSLGALTFEMLTGLPPYYSKDKDQLFARIRRGDLSYPSFCSKPAVAIMKGLLYRDPDRRIGGGDTDGEEVKSHPFWAGTDWARVLQRKLTPPFVPETGEATDAKYVDKEFLDLPVVNSEVPEPRGPGVHDKHFEGFTFDDAAA